MSTRAISKSDEDCSCSCFWREFGQIVNAEFLFDFRNLIDNLEKSILSEKLVFLLLEILSQRIELVGADDSVKRREQYCVLARFMRIIHTDEVMHRIRQVAPVVIVLERL